MTDWFAWHEHYDDPDDRFARRLVVVHEQIEAFLDAAPTRPLVVISVCAGQGRELIPVLARHPRGRDVTALLVELDPRNVARARTTAQEAGLDAITVREADAGTSDAYSGAGHADLLLLSGVLIHLARRDLRRFLRALPQLCAPGATVIWTRRDEEAGRRLREELTRAGLSITTLAPTTAGDFVGVARMTRPPRPLVPGRRWFVFHAHWTPLPTRVRRKLGRMARAVTGG